MDDSSVPVRRAKAVETMDSSPGGAVDASSVLAGRAEGDSDASSASGTDQANGDYLRAVLSERAAHELISWPRVGHPRQYWAAPRARANACRMILLNVSV